jgi:hypothetical protein
MNGLDRMSTHLFAQETLIILKNIPRSKARARHPNSGDTLKQSRHIQNYSLRMEKRRRGERDADGERIEGSKREKKR